MRKGRDRLMDNAQEILRHYVYAMTTLNDRQMTDVGVCICDLDKVLFYRPARTLDLKVAPGDAIKPGSALYRAIHEQRRVVVVQADASLYGVPYVGVGSPILDEQKAVIGAITISESTHRYDVLKQASAQVGQNIEAIASTAEEISAQTEEMAAASRTLTQSLNNSQNRVKDTDQVLGLIKAVAGQTNLLGLNAAIEAARVGDQGRGFGVVAEEIRKLATSTAESVKNIEDMIRAIQEDSVNTCQQMGQIDAMISQIASAVTQVAEAAQHLSGMAGNLGDLADGLIDAK
jgi:methyl-accepting chemotaxis protein